MPPTARYYKDSASVPDPRCVAQPSRAAIGDESESHTAIARRRIPHNINENLPGPARRLAKPLSHLRKRGNAFQQAWKVASYAPDLPGRGHRRPPRRQIVPRKLNLPLAARRRVGHIGPNGAVAEWLKAAVC